MGMFGPRRKLASLLLAGSLAPVAFAQESSRTFGEEGDALLARDEYGNALAAYREGIKSDGRNSFCGTCQSARKTHARFSSLVYSLMLAGEPGKRALEERRAWSRPNEALEKVLERYEKEGWKPGEKDPRFPPIPDGLRMPATLPR